MLIGYQREAAESGLVQNGSRDGLLTHLGEAPVAIIAPTGSGKGRDFIIPNILHHKGPLIVTDPKGELYAVTGRHRRKMGQVAALRPFGGKIDALNPFDYYSLPGSRLETDAEMFASYLSVGHEFGTDPFWSDSATGLLAGLIACMVSCGNPSIRTLTQILYADDLAMHIARQLDARREGSRLARDEFVAFLNIPEDRTRPCVLSTAQSYVKCLAADDVARSMEDSTISLRRVLAGDPITIYIIVPPEKLHSHRALLRLWIGVLLNTILKRQFQPEHRTLFILEEAAQLGTFPPLLTATTLMRAYGLQLITVWQNLAQLKSRYPSDWTTILDNCEVIMSFGLGHYGSACELGAYCGFDPARLLELRPDEAAVSIRHKRPQVIRRMNYLRDGMFRGMFDPNPIYQKSR